MEKFEIFFSEVYDGMVRVEANSLEEAMDKAYEMWSRGEAPADGDVRYEYVESNEA